MTGRTESYRVGLTADCAEPDGRTIFGDVGLERLTAAGLVWEVMAPVVGHVPTADDLGRYDAVLSFGHLHFTRAVVTAAPRLKHVARFGAGYDGIDLDGLADAGVVVTNTPLAVRQPLALAAMTLVLALGHRLVENHVAATGGRWTDRGSHRGAGVAGRTIGILGLGGVGSDLARLLASLGVRVISNDRPGSQEAAAELGVELVDIDRLAAESDCVVVTAALTESSYHLVDEQFLAAMKPSAYLVNVARGALVDQVVRGLCQRCGHHDVVRLGREAVDVDELDAELGCSLLRPGAVVGDHADPERCEQPGEVGADAAEPEDADRAAGDARAAVAAPVRPATAGGGDVVLDQPVAERQHERHRGEGERPPDGERRVRHDHTGVREPVQVDPVVPGSEPRDVLEPRGRGSS